MEGLKNDFESANQLHIFPHKFCYFSVTVSFLFFSSLGWKRHLSSSRVSGHNEAQRSACWFLCWIGQLIELPFVCLSTGHFRSLHFNHHLGLKCHSIDLLDTFTVSQVKGGQYFFCPSSKLNAYTCSITKVLFVTDPFSILYVCYL